MASNAALISFAGIFGWRADRQQWRRWQPVDSGGGWGGSGGRGGGAAAHRVGGADAAKDEQLLARPVRDHRRRVPRSLRRRPPAHSRADPPALLEVEHVQRVGLIAVGVVATEEEQPVLLLAAELLRLLPRPLRVERHRETAERAADAPAGALALLANERPALQVVVIAAAHRGGRGGGRRGQPPAPPGRRRRRRRKASAIYFRADQRESRAVTRVVVLPVLLWRYTVYRRCTEPATPAAAREIVRS